MLHEMIYLWGRKSLQIDSELTRKVVALLIHEKFLRSQMLALLEDHFNKDSGDSFYFEDRFKTTVLQETKAIANQVGLGPDFTNQVFAAEKEEIYRSANEQHFGLSQDAQDCQNLMNGLGYPYADTSKKIKAAYVRCKGILAEWGAVKEKVAAIEAQQQQTASSIKTNLAAATAPLKQALDTKIVPQLNQIIAGTCYTGTTLGVFHSGADLLLSFYVRGSNSTYGEDLERAYTVTRCDDFAI